MAELPDNEIARDLKTLVDHFDNEDLPVRQIQVRFWKKLKLYWNNFSQCWWSETDGTYKVWGRDEGNNTDQAYYDRPVNVFKAFLETIVAALSVQVPVISCVPDDADNPLDISTAKAGNIISQQLYKHNNVILLWLKALYVYCTEGMVACYTYVRADEEYGEIKEKKYKQEAVTDYFCPNCKQPLEEDAVIQSKLLQEIESNKFNPDEVDAELKSFNDAASVDTASLMSSGIQQQAGDALNPNINPDINAGQEQTSEPILCPNCALVIDPNLQKTTLKISKFDGYTSHPKSRICMEVYGGLYVKVANYAKKQCDTPYLIFSYETHYSNVLNEYPELYSSLPKGGGFGSYDPIDQYARLNIQYRGTFPEENVTVKNAWLRPSSFWILGEEKAKNYQRKFPDGVKVVKVNDVVCDFEAESLDDHWTLTENPMSDFLTHEPLGELLVNIQDIVNDLISLTLQTIEHGIAQTWVDPALVDVNQYGQIEAQPGTITPVKPVGGSKNIKDGFFTSQVASLSPEVFSFYRIVQELGQFVSGALPSLFGGASPGGSNTASEYAMSKGMALQRLQTPWKMLTIWWKKIFAKAIPMYMQILEEDERIVQKDKSGNYVNVFIRKAELEGKIGDIELENSEKLPLTEDEQKDVIMELIALNNSEIFAALAAPENLPFVRKIVRIPQFKIPGEDDRQKTYEDINELINSEPIPIELTEQDMIMAVEMGQEPQQQFESSVPVDETLDNHQISVEILRGWAVSEAGRLCKKENPSGYQNVLLKLKAHQDIIARREAEAMAMQSQQNSQTQGSENGAPKGAKQKGPEKINTGKENVPVS